MFVERIGDRLVQRHRVSLAPRRCKGRLAEAHPHAIDTARIAGAVERRQPIQAMADLGHGPRVRSSQVEAGRDCLGALDEQLDRRVARQLSHRR